jgi:capsular polysaccharide biosynthesis protein
MRQTQAGFQIVTDVRAAAAARRWRYTTCQPPTLQQSRASKCLPEDMTELLANSAHYMQSYYRTPEQAARAYAHLYAHRQYTLDETFTCEISDVKLVGQLGLIVTSANEIIAQSINQGGVKGAELTLLQHLPLRPTTHYSGTIVSLLGFATDNYSHWLLDTLPRLSLLPEDDTTFQVVVRADRSAFHDESLHLLGISAERVHSMALPSVSAERILLCCPGPKIVRHNAVHLHALRNRLMRAVGVEHAQQPSRRIYISRAKASRPLVNESEIGPVLRNYGFETVYCEELTFADQIRLFAEAEIILGAHGAGVCNLLFAKPGALVLEIFNRHRWERVFNRIAGFFGHTHWHTFGETRGTHWETAIAPDKLDRLIAHALFERSAQ